MHTSGKPPHTMIRFLKLNNMIEKNETNFLVRLFVIQIPSHNKMQQKTSGKEIVSFSVLMTSRRVIQEKKKKKKELPAIIPKATK